MDKPTEQIPLPKPPPPKATGAAAAAATTALQGGAK